MEKTFVMAKPDAVSRGLIGEIISRFERKGLKIVSMKMKTITPELSDKHYSEHIEKPFYPGLKKFITSAPVVCMVIEGENAVSEVRRLVGKTDPKEAAYGTIRADLANHKGRNMIHAADSKESAEKEIALHFGTGVVFENYKRSDEDWMYE